MASRPPGYDVSWEPAVLRFAVADTGAGIAKEKLGDLFQMFFKVEDENMKSLNPGK